jgi:hypothetical protein
MDLINGLIETVEGVDEKVFVAAGVLLLLGIISQPTFINLFVDIFKDALILTILYKLFNN